LKPTPRLAAATLEMPGAVYSPFADRIATHPGPVYPLHVGDTWLTPFEGGRSEDQRVADHPGLHNYCDTRGVPGLVDGVAQKLRDRNGLAAEPADVLIGAGATGGLATAIGAVLSPGEEVLILAPFWPLIRGIVQTFRGVPVEVPFYDRVDSLEEAVTAVRGCITPKSRVLYVSTPSNPTGRVIPGEWLEALAALAREHDLWLFSDEVYEDFVYRGEHVSMGRFAPERTASFYSFSKAYGMAGNRVGYLTGPRPLVDEARKIGTHTFYHAPTAGQVAAIRALESGREWIDDARSQYQRVGDEAASLLGIPEPAGSTFFMIDVREKLGERGLHGLLEDCFEDGVLVAPGGSCGREYEGWIRLCYTAMRPDLVIEAVSKLARHL